MGVLAGVGFGRVILVVGGRCDGGGDVRCGSSRDIRVSGARGHVTRGANSQRGVSESRNVARSMC